MFFFTTTITNIDFNQLFTSINWTRPTWDLFIIIFFVLASFLYGVSLGRDRIVVILVSIYMSLAVINYAPFVGAYEAEIAFADLFVFRISAFLGAFVLLFFLLSHSALLKTISASDVAGSWFQVLLFSILHVGLLISVTLSFLPPNALTELSSFTKMVFVDEYARFAWIVLPIFAMIFTQGKKEE
jgi:hypothetical protein